MKTAYQFGPLAFSLDGEHPIRGMLDREFASLRPAAGEPPLRFEFVDSVEAPCETTRVSDLWLFDNGFKARVGSMDCLVVHEEPGLSVRIAPKDWRGLSRALVRFWDWNYLLPEERQAKNFIYNVFDFTSQVQLLKLGASYIHASSFERDGRGVVLSAWGGIGKTTAMLKLVLEDDWRFLSDDLGLIDRQGLVYPTPKWMQIYAYNLTGEATLRAALMGGRSLADRASWAMALSRRGPKGVRRRVSAEQLFGTQRLGQPTKLTDLFFLERAGVQKIEARNVDREQFARHAASILLSELEPFTQISVAMHSAWRAPSLPSVEALRADAQAVFEQAFAHVEPVHVRIPEAAGPKQLVDFFRSVLG